ncbi:MAG: inositol monophosphatase [Phycisphaerales bacterium]|nr:MAG: inositol monophosphatase [Phycisphaerales bacterium]
MAETSIQDMLDLARRLATEAARISLSDAGRLAVERKPDDSIVTEADRAIQRLIFQAVNEAYPDHAVLGEEISGDSDCQGDPIPGQTEFCWVVDPLDGTRNYAAGFGVFGTSIAVLRWGRPVVGVVSEHNLGSVYTAMLGGGARLDDKPIRVQDPPPDEDFLVAIPSTKDTLSVKVSQTWSAADGFVCRNVGSTALHLALVASGTLAGAFAKRSKIWDIAAGWLLVSEAGGRVTDVRGGDRLPFSLEGDPNVDLPFLAAPPRMHKYLLETIRAAVP